MTLLLLPFTQGVRGDNDTYFVASSLDPDVLDLYVDGVLTERRTATETRLYQTLEGVPLDTLDTPSDNTDLNATTGYHGLLPKLSGASDEFLNGEGNWSTGDPATSIYGAVVILDSTAGAGGVASFSASGISDQYSKIVILLSGKSERTADTNGLVYIALNSDTTDANYGAVNHYAYNVGHDRQTADVRTVANIGGNATDGGSLMATIFNPGGTTYRKTIIAESMTRFSATSILRENRALNWENTAAISAIALTLEGGADFAEGTRCLILGYRVRAVAGSDGSEFVVLAPDSDTRNLIQPVADWKNLVLKAYSGQTKNQLEILSSAGALLANIEPDGEIAIPQDSKAIKLGGGLDASIYYDGTDGHIKTDLVAASDLHIDCGTDKTIVLDETVYDDMQVSISNIRVPAVNAPTERLYNGGVGGGITYPFLGFEVDDYIYFDVQTSHSMKLNTALDNHIHFTLPNTTNIGDKFKFQLDVIAAGINTQWEVPTGSPFSAEHTVAANDNTYHRYLDIADIPSSNDTVSSIYKCRLTRVAASANEYGSEVYLTFTDCHYEKDTMGSRQEKAK